MVNSLLITGAQATKSLTLLLCLIFLFGYSSSAPTIISAISIGAVHTITFSENVNEAMANSVCAGLVTEGTLDHLGAGARCLFPSENTFEIDYGHDMTAGQQTITLFNYGFTPTLTGDLSFIRPEMPSFQVTTNFASGYQDISNTVTLDNINTNNQAEMNYIWTYQVNPQSTSLYYKGPEVTREFNFWELVPGEYQVKIKMTDPNNLYFYLSQLTPSFTVTNSCDYDCDHITWTLSRNPGSCSNDCATGHDPSVDSLDFLTSGSSAPYTIRATYRVGSKGGKNLSIVPEKYNNLHMPGCGTEIKFPVLEASSLSECQSSSNSVSITGILDTQGLSYSMFNAEWTQPYGTSACVKNNVSCVVDPGELKIGGPYAYKIEMRLTCQGADPPLWSESTFTEFLYSPSFVTSTEGSIQTLTFDPPATLAAGDSCAEVMTPDSVPVLGEGAECSMTNAGGTYTIKYGSGASAKVDIALLTTGFVGCTAGTFNSSNLLRFIITSTGSDTPLYHDNSAVFTTEIKVNMGQVPITYEWTHVLPAASESPMPDLSGVTGDTFTFNYWEMSAGDHKISIKLKDIANTLFFHQEESPIFTILDSCSTNDCDIITWKLNNDPGSCAANCVTGQDPEDVFEFATAGASSPYTVTAKFLQGSVGKKDISLIPGEYNNLHSTPCGKAIKFPYIVVKEDAPAYHSSGSDLILSVTLTGVEDRTLDVDYNETWIQPVGISYCTNGTSSCTIPSEGLVVEGGPYAFKIQVKALCKSSIVWREVVFTEFQYSASIANSILGSIQRITLTETIVAVDGDSCEKLLTEMTHLGTGYSCSLSANILTIKYGSETTIGSQTISLKGSGFNPVAVGSFGRPNLPKFTMLETGETDPMYQDNSLTISATDIVNVGDSVVEYAWSYSASGGTMKPDLASVTATTFIFNYWEMSPGDYQIRIKMTQPENANYYYQADSTLFTILNSCSSNNCEEISWKFNGNPGSCLTDCTTGQNAGDTLEFASTGSSSPYIVTATYKPESTGGMNLTLVPAKFNGLNNVGCGENIKFPNIKISQNAPEIQSSGSPLTLEGTLISNGLILDNHYTQIWVKPQGAPCVDGTSTCVIGIEGLTIGGGPYTFKIQIALSCHLPDTELWSEAVFQTFLYSPALSVISVGSVQTLSFSRDMELLSSNSCEGMLTEDSLPHLGTDYQCSLTDPRTIYIKYGYGTSIGTPILSLNSDAFAPMTEGIFNRIALPRFSMATTGMDTPTYQDNSGTITAENIVNTGNGDLKFKWSYIVSPEGGTKPDIALEVGSFFVFNYWELTHGTYQVRLQLTDPLNTPFYYQEISPSFTVLQSCSLNCNVVTWTLQGDPGDCDSDCLTGQGPYDSFDFLTTGSSSPYTITATFKPGSRGGRSLSISPSKYNSLNSFPCGEELKFQTITIKEDEDAPEIQSSESDLTLTGILSDTVDLILDTHYREIWVEAVGFNCADESPSCRIVKGELNNGEGPYIFKIQIKLMCIVGEPLWSEISFNEFRISSSIAVSTLGSVQRITFSTSVSPSGGTACSDLLTADSLPHLGDTYECSLANNIMIIKYGTGTVSGEHTITLISSAFTPNTPQSFLAPILPHFQIFLTGHQIPAYQDNQVEIVAYHIINIGGASLIYEWTYLNVPVGGTMKPDLTGETGSMFTFNYWEMSPGSYSINLKLKDPENTHFYYDVDSPSFTILDGSCSITSCDTITWKFTNNPGFCSSNCFIGTGSSDSLTAVTTGSSSPYTLTATYSPESLASNDISINPIKFKGLHNVPCGSDIKFVTVNVISVNTPLCQSSGSDLYLESTLYSNELVLDTDYSMIWRKSSEITMCKVGLSSCTIPARSLPLGGPYEIEIEVKMLNCNPTTIWSKVTFNDFYYAPTLTTSTIGSIQTVTFSAPVSATINEDCSGLFTSESMNHLGTDPKCAMTATTLEIKYGRETTPGSETIYLYNLGNGDCTLGNFTRGILPSFTLQEVGIGSPAYQDHSATFTAGLIINPEGVPLTYIWKYITHPGAEPDLTGESSTIHTVNYWEMLSGDYVVRVRMLDSANSQYAFDQQSHTFTIRDSCSTTCRSISWKFEGYPGTCLTHCATGLNTLDKIEFLTTGSSSPYTVTAIYKSGSIGGKYLQLSPGQFNGLNSVKCGVEVKFPSVVVEEDASDLQTPESYLTLSGTLEAHSLTLDTHYTITWVSPENFVPACANGSLSCVVPPESLDKRADPYIFKLQINLLCGGSAQPWSQVLFQQFTYASAPRAHINGGAQSYYSNANIILSAENSRNMNEDPAATAQGLIFLWECFTGITLQEGCQTQNNLDLPPSSDMQYGISANELLGDKIYYFRLTVTEQFVGKTDQSTTHVTVMAPSNTNPPLVKILTNLLIDNLINPEIDNTFEISFKADSDNAVRATYKWKIEPGIESTTISDRFLTIGKGVLRGSEIEYILSCKVSVDEGSSTVQISFRPAREVTGGKLTSNLEEGEAFDTEFTLRASDFLPGEEEKLEYKYYAQVEGIGTIIPLTPKYLYTHIFTTILPFGDISNEYKLLLIVTARNVLHMVKSVNTTVIVKASSTYNSSFVKNKLSEIEDSGEKIQFLMQSSPLSTQGKGQTNVGACGKCNLDFGSCDESTEKCVCEEGYASPYCSLTNLQTQNNILIMTEIGNNIENMLLSLTNITNSDIIGLLTAATVNSEGVYLGDSESNLILERIVVILTNKLQEGTLDIEEGGEPLFKLLSNLMEGIDIERKYMTAILTSEISESLYNRQNSLVDKVKVGVKSKLRTVPVGMTMDQISQYNFDIIGKVNVGKLFANSSLQTEKGPKVIMPSDVQEGGLTKGGLEEILMGISYIDLKFDIHPSNTLKPRTNTIELGLSNINSGNDITIKDLVNPVKIDFEITDSVEKLLYSCVFYDQGKETYSVLGLKKITEEGNAITCTSTHLSEFTIVSFPITANDTDSDNNKTWEIILICCLAISIIILIIVIAAISWIKYKVW